jgi:hypothetical protein
MQFEVIGKTQRILSAGVGMDWGSRNSAFKWNVLWRILLCTEKWSHIRFYHRGKSWYANTRLLCKRIVFWISTCFYLILVKIYFNLAISSSTRLPSLLIHWVSNSYSGRRCFAGSLRILIWERSLEKQGVNLPSLPSCIQIGKNYSPMAGESFLWYCQSYISKLWKMITSDMMRNGRNFGVGNVLLHLCFCWKFIELGNGRARLHHVTYAESCSAFKKFLYRLWLWLRMLPMSYAIEVGDGNGLMWRTSDGGSTKVITSIILTMWIWSSLTKTLRVKLIYYIFKKIIIILWKIN